MTTHIHRVALSVLAGCLLGHAAVAQSVAVVVLDGRSGKPVKKDTAIQIAFPDEAEHRMLRLHTDRAGVVEFDAEGAKELQVGAIGYMSCHEGQGDTTAEKFSVEQIVQDGLVGSNHCGQALVQPHPGRLVYYVKPQNKWSNLRNQGLYGNNS
jgi:hypothetical protein